MTAGSWRSISAMRFLPAGWVDSHWGGAPLLASPILRHRLMPARGSKPARAVHDLVRAMQPWPAASTFWHPAEVGKPPLRLIVLKSAVVEGQGEPGRVLAAEKDDFIVAAGESAVRLLTVQIAGKRPMPATEFLRGHRVLPGDRMGPES